MGKLVMRYLCWLGAITAFVQFMFFLISGPKDNLYMKIHSSQDDAGFVGCEFSGSTEGGLAYRLKFTPGECRLVEYSGSNLIRFAVEYPGMEVADFSGEVKKSLVFFYLEYVSQSKFDENRVLEGKVPSSVVDGVESYDVGGFVERKFKGGDGVFVYVSSEINTFRASRLYRPGLWVSYQYSKLNDDVRKMDDFALKVLGKAIVE